MDNMFSFGLLLSILLRWCTSLFSYSGARKPPMYGDYEAQRHWMEITVNLPDHQWYQNSSKNDLLYWGLDYPPLTAYHSYLCGYISKLLNPDWIALTSSRGYESYDHKIFMRSTVLISDLVIYIPAVVYFWNIVAKPFKPRDKAVCISLTMLYPGLILIDHGHFQYNCVSLGLMLWAVLFLYTGLDYVAAVCFMLALNYKQMELYHALPFFAYLLGTCRDRTLFSGLRKFVLLGLVVVGTTAICWTPFLFDRKVALQVLARLFPVGRGLYEDKVANFWCSISIFVKLRELLSLQTLVVVSGASTLLAALPSCTNLVFRPNFSAFKYSLVTCSLAFFLFSYQVHEKSILLAAVPFLLLVDDHPVMTTWFIYISTFSLLPLLAKDQLVIPYFSLTVIFIAVSLQAYHSAFRQCSKLEKLTILASVAGSLVLSVASLTVKPPSRFPDVHVMLNAMYSCGHFLAFFVYTTYLQFQILEVTSLKKKS